MIKVGLAERKRFSEKGWDKGVWIGKQNQTQNKHLISLLTPEGTAYGRQQDRKMKSEIK
jgi:hypothetical protein